MVEATPHRILIAEDEPLVRLDLREMLTALGYQVVGEASDGATAVRLARETRPDIVIMDIQMPELNGLDAAQILTAENIAPVLLLTAYSQKELVERAQRVGVVGYLVKPFRDSDIQPAVEVALARFEEFRAVREQVRTLEESLETRKIVDRAKGILTDTQGLKEADAFRRIQKLSMDARKSMREVAEAILLAHQV